MIFAVLFVAGLAMARAVPAAESYRPPPREFDSFKRLASYADKTPIACPGQNGRTAVMLLIGQSNSANHASRKYASGFGDRVVNYFDGKCYVAQSPLLGASGTWGEPWTLLGNKLVASGGFDKVILVPAAVYGSAISRWQQGGDLNRMLLDVAARVSRQYRITHVLWHQGETDFTIGTGEQQYRARFQSLLSSVRKAGIAAPFYVSVATKCTTRPWSEDNPVARAQIAIPDASARVFPGVNSDKMIGDGDRYDNCHFSAGGQEKFASAWVAAIRSRR